MFEKGDDNKWTSPSFSFTPQEEGDSAGGCLEDDTGGGAGTPAPEPP